jgi:hypothetical protein
MTDREKVIESLNKALTNVGYGDMDNVTLSEVEESIESAIALLREQEALAAHQRDEFMRSWRTIKFSVMDTANNNAGDGNEDIYRILTWVATMMDQREAKWNA